MMSSIYPQPSSVSSSKNNGGVRFPEDIQVIIRSDRTKVGNLYLGNIEAAQNTQILQNLQITAVVSAAKGHNIKHPKSIIKISKYIPLEDDDKCQIQEFLNQTSTFISDKLKQTNIKVLVHCVAGVSRSAALVIAFIMKERGLTLEDAFNEVKSRRKTVKSKDMQICLSENILEQLRRYEQTLFSRQSNQNNSSLRMDTVAKSHMKSFLKTKTNHNQDLNRSMRVKSNSSKLLPDDFDEIKSHQSKHSMKSDTKINIEVLAPRQVKNPEESFITRKSALKEQSQLMNKSLGCSRRETERNQSSFESLSARSNKELQISQRKMTSQIRSEFAKKMTRVDLLNEKLNYKFELAQDRFDTESKAHKQTLEGQLNEIYKAKANIYSKYTSERKAKMSERRSVHDKTMQDKEVKEYIMTNLTERL